MLAYRTFAQHGIEGELFKIKHNIQVSSLYLCLKIGERTHTIPWQGQLCASNTIEYVTKPEGVICDVNSRCQYNQPIKQCKVIFIHMKQKLFYNCECNMLIIQLSYSSLSYYL